MSRIKFITIGGITIDDTVSPNGQLILGAAGGNSIYSAVGAKHWSDGIGIVGRIGSDYPEEYLELMVEGGLDVSGIIRVDGPSNHLWVLYEKGGRRQIIVQKQTQESGACLDPDPEQFPEKYLNANMCHLSATEFKAQQKMAHYLDECKMPFSYDITQASTPSDSNEFGGIGNFAISHCDLLLPSIEEIEMIWGKISLKTLFKQITDGGPKIVAVKMGGKGSLVFDAHINTTYRIPIVPVNAVDSTGAGDSYCGGFMAGYSETGDAIEAGIRGTVSASFAIEDFGALHGLGINRDEKLERLNKLRTQVEPVAGYF